jgi:hypothetical protein
MATKATATVEDDLVGSPAQANLRHGIGTAEYEIDLSAAKADRLRAHLAPFIDHAHKAECDQAAQPDQAAIGQWKLTSAG